MDVGIADDLEDLELRISKNEEVGESAIAEIADRICQRHNFDDLESRWIRNIHNQTCIWIAQKSVVEKSNRKLFGGG